MPWLKYLLYFRGLNDLSEMVRLINSLVHPPSIVLGPPNLFAEINRPIDSAPPQVVLSLIHPRLILVKVVHLPLTWIMGLIQTSVSTSKLLSFQMRSLIHLWARLLLSEVVVHLFCFAFAVKRVELVVRTADVGAVYTDVVALVCEWSLVRRGLAPVGFFSGH